MGKKFIVVTAGRKPGVYRGWAEAAPHVLGISKAIYSGYDSETDAYAAFGLSGFHKQRRVLEADDSDETPQSSVREEEPERRPTSVSARNNVRTGPPEEIVVQCPPILRSRPQSTIQRSTTLPAQHTPRSSSNAVQRSRTVPDVESRSTPSTPKNVRVQKSPASNISRSRVISISTDDSDEESIPPSPATNVSSTLSPTFGHLPLSPPRDESPSRPSPARKRDKDDGHRHRYQRPTAQVARGSKSSGHVTSGSPSKKAINTAGGSVRSPTRGGTSRQDQSLRRVAWDSSPTADRRVPHSAASRTPRDRSGSRPPPSPGGSLQLIYVSGDGSPTGDLNQSVGDTDYYTPSSRDLDTSDAESEPSERVPSSTLKRKGKRRASPPPPSSYPRSSPPSSHMGSSPRNPDPVSGRSHKKRRDRRTRPLNDNSCRETREQAPARDSSQSAVQDVCHCAGPCPSCHKQRLPFPPNPNPTMIPPFPYNYLYFSPPPMQAGYPLSHYGPPYPYPYPIPQHPDLLPSISSAPPIPPSSEYPIHPPPATYPPTAHFPNVPAHVSPPPAPAPAILASGSSASASVPSPPVDVGSPPLDPPATQQVSPESLNPLGQFYQPQQRPVTVIPPSCDPRSPYSKKAVVPAFPNSSIIMGRPETPLSPLEGLGLAL